MDFNETSLNSSTDETSEFNIPKDTSCKNQIEEEVICFFLYLY